MVDPLVKNTYDWRHVIERFFDSSPAAVATEQLLRAAKRTPSARDRPLESQ